MLQTDLHRHISLHLTDLFNGCRLLTAFYLGTHHVHSIKAARLHDTST